MTPTTTNVTAVIAAKNEAATIGHIVLRTKPFCARVIVVDGRSTDGTGERPAHATHGAEVVQQGTSMGKGAALRIGLELVMTPITVFLDADGSHVPEDIPALLAPILDGRADHVSASRTHRRVLGTPRRLRRVFRLAGSSFITACINWRFGVRLSDSQNGFRAIRTPRANAEPAREHDHHRAEMIIRTLKTGGRMAEVRATNTRGSTGARTFASGGRLLNSKCPAARPAILLP